MTYTLPLGTTAALRFENAINESQALAQLRSSFPQLTRGLLRSKGWMEVTSENFPGGAIGNNVDIVDNKHFVRDEAKDIYNEPEIKLIENCG